MKRPFEPNVDCHIDFLKQTLRPDIACDAETLLIAIQEVLVTARQEAAGLRQSAVSKDSERQQQLTAIGSMSAMLLDRIEQSAQAYATNADQLKKDAQPTVEAREVRELLSAHEAVGYVLREARKEIGKLSHT